MSPRKISYSTIFSEKHYDKTFIFAIFVMFVFIFYSIYQIYSINNQGNDQGAKETPDINPSVPVSQKPATSQYSSTIEFTQLPERVAPNEKFIAEWAVNSDEPKFVAHTAVHYGYESRDVTADTTSQAAGYEFFTPEFASGEYPIPNIFATAMELPKEGTVYMRAHAIIDGKNYWTQEKKIIID